MNGTDAVLELVSTPADPSVLEQAAADLTAVRAAGPDPLLRQVLGDAAERPTGRAWLFGSAAATLQLGWGAAVAAAAARDAGPEAAAAGLVVARAVADALGPAHAAAGWWPEATAGVVGAAAAAAHALGLRDTALRNTLGIAATQASGLASAAGTPLGAVQLGRAAATGVEAAHLARNGFTAAEDPLSGRRGMYAVMSAAQ